MLKLSITFRCTYPVMLELFGLHVSSLATLSPSLDSWSTLGRSTMTPTYTAILIALLCLYMAAPALTVKRPAPRICQRFAQIRAQNAYSRRLPRRYEKYTSRQSHYPLFLWPACEQEEVATRGFPLSKLCN
jgi:hypothetical protein